MMSHPFPDGSLVWTTKSWIGPRTSMSGSFMEGKRGSSEKVLAIVESYVREYNPVDSFYFVLVNEELQMRDREVVWFVK